MASWHSRRARWGALSPGERRLLVQAFVALPLVSASLRWRGFRRTERTLERLRAPVGAQAGGDVLAQAQLLARLVDTAGAYSPLPAVCLPRALTLRWLLRRQGIEGALRFGVQPAGDLLRAHAWVEVEGVALGETDDLMLRYAPLQPAGAASGGGS